MVEISSSNKHELFDLIVIGSGYPASVFGIAMQFCRMESGYN